VASIKDIAREANVSPATVSKALNKRKDISEATREKILRIAESHDFVPSAIGRSLKNQRTENIGVIFCRESQPLSGNPFYSRVLEGIEAELTINNYNLVLHLLPNDYKGTLPKMLREGQVDGVVLAGVLRPDFIERLRNLSIGVVLVDPKIIIDDFSQVLIDNEHGAFQAVEHLISRGHERIGFISGNLDRMSFIQRYKGYQKALSFHKIHLDKDLVRSGGLEQGYDHTVNLLKMENPPTAIFAANDINAIYGYKAITDSRLRIPEDISVIGFDDIEMAKISSPPLSTIRVYKEEMGSIAVRTLLQIINNELDRPVTTLVPTRLVERGSVGPVK
jgi:LacI family transcriptional regulator